MLEKLKKIADQAKEKAGPLAEQAKERATELAAEAREKAGPLAEQAKERATELASKAAPAVAQGIDKAADSLDKATKGRYSEQIDKVQEVVHDTAQKVGDKSAGAGTGTMPAADTTAADTTAAGAATAGTAAAGTTAATGPLVEPVSPVVIPAEPVEVPPPAPTPTLQTDPGLDSPAANPHVHKDEQQS